MTKTAEGSKANVSGTPNALWDRHERIYIDGITPNQCLSP